MGRICDIIKSQRPREKALRYGIDKLSDYELLAILIGSGTKDHSALDISCELINTFNGMNNLIFSDYKKITKFKGMSIIKSIQLIACFELIKRYHDTIIFDEKVFSKEVEDILTKYHVIHRCDKKEHFYIIALNKNKSILFEKEFYIGTENKAIVSIEEIIKFLKQNNINYFILIHNHPNNLTFPSDHDIIFTDELSKKCKKEQIKLINHYILADNRVISILQNIVSKTI